MNLRSAARDRDCQVRLAGICNHNRETVVLAHFRLSGLSGMGMKSPDLIAAWTCGACHTVVDSSKDPQIQLAFAHGVFRTQAQLLREGKIGE